MKFKYIFTTLTLIFIAQLVTAQRPNKHEMHKKVEAYKVAYLTEKLDLTTEEAQKFWPLYNDIKKQEDSLRRVEHKSLRKDGDVIDTMTDKQLESFVDQRIKLAQQKLDLKKQYHSKLKEVLPIKKIAQLYIAEREFKKYLLNKLGGRGHGHGRGHGRGPSPCEF